MIDSGEDGGDIDWFRLDGLAARAFHASPTILAIGTMPERRWIEVNCAFLERTGYRRAEVIGRTSAELGLWCDPDCQDALASDLVARGWVRDVETRFRTKGGKVISCLVSAELIESPGRSCALFVMTDVTEFKRVESELRVSGRALRESEELHRRLVATIPDIVIRTDVDGRVVAVNDVAARVAGFLNNEALVGENILSFVAQEDRERASANHRLMFVRRLGPQVYRLSLSSGLQVDCEINGDVLRQEDGTPYGVIHVVRDITDRKRVEQDLRFRNRELAVINRVMGATVGNLSPSAMLEVACRELAVALDVSCASAALVDEQRAAASVVAEYSDHGRPLLGSLEPGSTPVLVAAMFGPWASLASEDVQSDPRLASIRKILTREGVASLLAVPLVVAGIPAGSLILVARTRRRFTAEEVSLASMVASQVAGALSRVRIAETHRLLITAIEQTPESVVITDPSGRILYVNPAFERTTGHSASEACGQNPRLLKSGRHDDAFYRDLWATIGSGKVWHGRITNRKRDDSLYVEDTIIAPVRDEAGAISHYVAVKHDVTRELAIEAQCHQAQKLESIGRLAGGIAHDFNNLLVSIGGHAELALDSLPVDHPAADDLLIVRGAVGRAAGLTGQLLAFARRQVIEPKVVDLNVMITDLGKMLPRLIGENVELVLDLADGLGRAEVDAGQIEQVLVNLVVNARDAMPGGGRLTVRTTNAVLDEGDLGAPSGLGPGEYVSVSVSDTGTGIPEAVRKHVFEPFFTTKESGKGTGLGLATCFGILEQNRGHISFTTETGQGTTFTFYLPRVEEAPSPEPSERVAAGSHSRGTETILVAEDEPEVRRVVARVLRDHGYRVLEASSANEAVSRALADGPRVRLLVTDVVMPERSGRDLAAQLQGLCPDIKVLFMSGHTMLPIIEDTAESPGARFIPKPFTPAELTAKVREALDAR